MGPLFCNPRFNQLLGGSESSFDTSDREWSDRGLAREHNNNPGIQAHLWVLKALSNASCILQR